MTAKVPNYNALSSLLDRLAIENNKLAFFETALEFDPLSDAERATYEEKAANQRRMIDILKQDTIECMDQALIAGKYEYIREGRTFK